MKSLFVLILNKFYANLISFYVQMPFRNMGLSRPPLFEQCKTTAGLIKRYIPYTITINLSTNTPLMRLPSPRWTCSPEHAAGKKRVLPLQV